MTYKALIVGREGTTGLRIDERLAGHPHVEVIALPEELRKDVPTIVAKAKEAHVVFLCLPDAASKEIVSALVEAKVVTHEGPVVIDTSTAFRTSDDWAYGFPELSPAHEIAIKTSKWIANPGCHASGMIALIHPLVEAGVLAPTSALSAVSLTGYSGGGKKMIADYESPDKGKDLLAPRHYALGQSHKHLPEVMKTCELTVAPVFMPIVDDYYSGMLVSIPLQASTLAKSVTIDEITDVFQKAYAHSKVVKVADLEGAMLSANHMTGKDSMEIYVTGNDDRIVVHAVYDNLGKGASGAAVECMNIALGLEKTLGLNI